MEERWIGVEKNLAKARSPLWLLLPLWAGCIGQADGPVDPERRQPYHGDTAVVSCGESVTELHRRALAVGDGSLVCTGTHFGWVRQRQLDDVNLLTYHSVALVGKPDGSERAFVAQHQGAPRILQRRSTGAMEDRCAGSGSGLCAPSPPVCPTSVLGLGEFECAGKQVSACPAGDRHGLTIGDLTDDGEPDLMIASGARCGCGLGPNEYFPDVRDGAAASEMAWLPGGAANPELADFVAKRRRSRSLHLADVDLDGDLDLFMLNNSWCGKKDHLGVGNICSIASLNQDCQSYDNRLLLNEGIHGSGIPDLRNADGVSGGFNASAAGWINQVYHHGRALLIDLDLDNAPELVIGGPGFAVFHNEDGAAWRRYASPVRNGVLGFDVHDLAAGDMDGDGDPDLVIVGVAPTASGQKEQRFAFLRNDSRDPYHCGEQGSGTVSPLRLVPTPVVNDGLRGAPEAMPVGIALGDVNNDGDLDLVITNVDAQDETRNRPNHLLINTWDTRRGKAGVLPCYRYGWVLAGRQESSGAEGPEAGASDGAVFWDIDADGREDLLLLNGRGATAGPLRQLRNLSQSAHRWLRVMVALGAGKNRYGIGARVEVVQPAMKVVRWIDQPRWLAVGLGSSGGADVTVRVTWPDGRTARRCVKKDSEVVIDSLGGSDCAP